MLSPSTRYRAEKKMFASPCKKVIKTRITASINQVIKLKGQRYFSTNPAAAGRPLLLWTNTGP